jgi:hypothetical protein
MGINMAMLKSSLSQNVVPGLFWPHQTS